MKKTKRAISLLLVVLMLASLSVAAFAEEPQEAESKYQHFDSVFTIGDSNACGYGVPGYKTYPLSLNGVPGSFPEIVAETLGVERENHNCLAFPAERAKDALFYLKGDVDMTEDKYFNDYYDTWMKIIANYSGTDGNVKYAVGDNYVNQLAQKDGDNKLVILYAGSADIFFASACNAAGSLFSGGGGELDIAAIATGLVEELFKNYASFTEVVPKLIERIQEINPDATIVIVGTYNPLKDLKIGDDSVLPVFDAAAVLTGLMNAQYKDWAEKYGCKFADITNTETRTLEENITLTEIIEQIQVNPSNAFGFFEEVYHATPEGFAYIARQILREIELQKAPISTNIVVDLGASKKVEAVSVDKYSIKNYQYNEATHELFIPYLRTDAVLLTVTVDNGDGTTSLYSYQLNFGEKGYTAYRVYATNDLAQTIRQIITKLIDAFRAMLEAFFGLFNPEA